MIRYDLKILSNIGDFIIYFKISYDMECDEILGRLYICNLVPNNKYQDSQHDYCNSAILSLIKY